MKMINLTGKKIVVGSKNKRKTGGVNATQVFEPGSYISAFTDTVIEERTPDKHHTCVIRRVGIFDAKSGAAVSFCQKCLLSGVGGKEFFSPTALCSKCGRGGLIPSLGETVNGVSFLVNESIKMHNDLSSENDILSPTGVVSSYEDTIYCTGLVSVVLNG